MTETERILAVWQQEQNMKATARLISTTEQRVRRILIDAGICPSKRTETIQAMSANGLTRAEIAEKLGITVRAVDNYFPHTRGTYTGKSHTTKWRRTKEDTHAETETT